MYEQILYVSDDVGRMLEQDRLRTNPVSEFGGGGFISTPSDLARWAAAFYGGDLLPGDYLEVLAADPTPDPFPDHDPKGRLRSQGYGLGTWITETTFGRAFGHGGFFPGYLSAVMYFEELETAVAIQTNRVEPELNLGLVVLDIADALSASPL